MGLKVRDVLSVVRLVSKAGKSTTIKPSRELTVTCTQAVDSKIKLFGAKKQWSTNVLLDKIGFGWSLTLDLLLLLLGFLLARLFIYFVAFILLFACARNWWFRS